MPCPPPLMGEGMNQHNWQVRADRVVMNTYGRQPLVLVRGEGCRVWDDEGREYLDFVAGLAVCNLGHAHPAIAQAASQQLERLVHVSNIYYTTPMVELAEELVCLSFADRVFFCNSGAEAMEGAIKLSRRYAAQRFGPQRHKFVCMENSFHGRTLGALSATGQQKFWQGFAPLLPGFAFVPFNDLAALEKVADDSVCGIILEPVQGEGGVNLATAEYLAAVRQLCDDRGILLVFDEVQCGLGRTGRLFAHEHSGVSPDIMALAKALAGDCPWGRSWPPMRRPKGLSPGPTPAPLAAGR